MVPGIPATDYPARSVCQHLARGKSYGVYPGQSGKFRDTGMLKHRTLTGSPATLTQLHESRWLQTRSGDQSGHRHFRSIFFKA
jgi:hypothetical protein